MDTDVYIKDEGFAQVMFLSDRAKDVASALFIPNSLQEFGDTFCDKPVWNEKTRIGVYRCGFKLSYLNAVVKDLKDAGLTVECEFCLANL